MADESLPNSASNTNGQETNPPTVKLPGNAPQVGEPTTPKLSRGLTANTTIEQMNNSLSHACDFSQDIKKSIGLKKFFKAIAQQIRKAIRAIKRFLGLSDSSGLISTIIQKLKNIAAEINNFVKEYIKPVQQFLKDVAKFVQYCIDIICC